MDAEWWLRKKNWLKRKKSDLVVGRVTPPGRGAFSCIAVTVMDAPQDESVWNDFRNFDFNAVLAFSGRAAPVVWRVEKTDQYRPSGPWLAFRRMENDPDWPENGGPFTGRFLDPHSVSLFMKQGQPMGSGDSRKLLAALKTESAPETSAFLGWDDERCGAFQMKEEWPRMRVLWTGDETTRRRRMAALDEYGVPAWKLLEDPEGRRLTDAGECVRDRMAAVTGVSVKTLDFTYEGLREVRPLLGWKPSSGDWGDCRLLEANVFHHLSYPITGSRASPAEVLLREVEASGDRLPANGMPGNWHAVFLSAVTHDAIQDEKGSPEGFDRWPIVPIAAKDLKAKFDEARTLLSDMNEFEALLRDEVVLPWCLQERSEPFHVRMTQYCPAKKVLIAMMDPINILDALRMQAALRATRAPDRWLGLLEWPVVSVPEMIAERMSLVEMTDAVSVREALLRRLGPSEGSHGQKNRASFEDEAERLWKRCVDGNLRMLEVRVDGVTRALEAVGLRGTSFGTRMGLSHWRGGIQVHPRVEKALSWLDQSVTQGKVRLNARTCVSLRRAHASARMDGTYVSWRGSSVAFHLEAAFPGWRDPAVVDAAWRRWRVTLGADAFENFGDWMSSNTKGQKLLETLRDSLKTYDRLRADGRGTGATSPSGA